MFYLPNKQLNRQSARCAVCCGYWGVNVGGVLTGNSLTMLICVIVLYCMGLEGSCWAWRKQCLWVLNVLEKTRKKGKKFKRTIHKKDVKIVAHGDVPRISAVEQLNLASMYTRQSQRLAGRISEFFSTTHTRCSFFPSRQRFLNLFVLCANPMLVIVCYGRIESLHVTMDDSWLQWEQIVTWIWTCGSPSQLQRLWRGRLCCQSHDSLMKYILFHLKNL